MFSPDGDRIIALGENTGWLLDAEGKELVNLGSSAELITGAVFKVDGSRILTVGEKAVRLWDADGRELATLSGYTERVTGAIFSQDGRRIFTASADGNVRQYVIGSENLLRLAACRVQRDLTEEEIRRCNVPVPLKLDLKTRECPPKLSWEK